jgi:DNA mismatch repair protein MSH4
MSNTILEDLLSSVRESIGCLYMLSEVVSQVDVLLSLAEVSQRPGYVRPVFGDGFVVRDGRHPILDHMGAVIVPNDATATLESNFVVITGAAFRMPKKVPLITTNFSSELKAPT